MEVEVDGNRANGREAAVVALAPKEVEIAEKTGGRGSDRVHLSCQFRPDSLDVFLHLTYLYMTR